MLEEVHFEVSEEEGAYLSKYQKMNLLGRCNGLFMGNVMLNECQITE